MIKSNKPLIFTCLAVCGTFGIAFTTYKATLKADEVLKDDSLTKKEKAVKVWKDYIPVGIMVGGTAACIIASHRISKKQMAAVASAASLSGKLVGDYQQAIREKYGEEGLDDIHRIIAEKAEPPVITAEGLCAINKGLPNDGKEVLFYDEFADRWFRSTINAVKEAEYHLNRNFVLRGYATLGEFYEFLGLDVTDNAEDIGWNAYDGYGWVDFGHVQSRTSDGETYYIISYVFVPEELMEFIKGLAVSRKEKNNG